MGEIVVFPEQFSFDVRQQRSNPRRRLTIKNLGIMACKITIMMPETDSFTITDSKGKAINSKVTTNMIPDSSYCLFVQKKANVGIVPEDKIVITGGKKPYNVILKPAVSLVSLEELENAAAGQDQAGGDQSARSADSEVPSSHRSRVKDDDECSSQDEYEPKHRVSRLRPPHSKTKAGRGDQAFPDNGFDPMKKSRKPIEPQKVDNFEFSASDFQIPQLAEDEEEPPVKQTPVKPTQQKQASQGQVSARKQATNNSNKDDKNDEIGMPKKLEQSPSKRQSQIPVSKRSHPDLPPDADVLERSLHVKFSFKDDTFSKPPQKASHVKWYEDDAFDKVEEPDFSFELMMTAEGEDPVFCIDGDYYDSSGRMLSVQQGKGKVIFVTEDGYETNETDE